IPLTERVGGRFSRTIVYFHHGRTFRPVGLSGRDLDPVLFDMDPTIVTRPVHFLTRGSTRVTVPILGLGVLLTPHVAPLLAVVRPFISCISTVCRVRGVSGLIIPLKVQLRLLSVAGTVVK